MCIVLSKGESSTSQHKSLQLSMRSSLIHRGTNFKHLSMGMPLWVSVASVEDHGYILDCGINDAVCFLPNKKSASSGLAHHNFVAGQPLYCVIDSLNDVSKTITVKIGKKAFVDSITRGTQIAFKCLCPGMQVHCIVEHLLEVLFVGRL